MSSFGVRRVRALALVMLCCATSRALAQEQTGSIEGKVQTSLGAPASQALVRAAGTAGVIEVRTDTSGRYRFPALPPGTFRVTADFQGARAVAASIELTLGQTLRVDLRLRPAGVAEEEEHGVETPLIDVKQSARSATVRREAIEKLPRTRDFTSIILQAPGAALEQGLIQIDGSSGSENRFIVDAIEITDPVSGLSSHLITDFVEELQVKSSGSGAEYGGATGGVVNVLTRSGTNDWKFDATVYYFSDRLAGEARPTLRQQLDDSSKAEYIIFPKDSFSRVEPGISAAGPLLTDRLWAFASYHPAIVSTSRTVTFLADGLTRTRDQELLVHYGAASLSGQIGDRLHARVAYTQSTGKQQGFLPSLSGTSNPNANFDVDTNAPTRSLSANLDLSLSPSTQVNLRGGEFLTDFSQDGIYDGPRYLFLRSNIGLPGVPTDLQRPLGYTNALTNYSYRKDLVTRRSAAVDATRYFSLAGEHAVKGGVQFDRIGEDVDSGEARNVANLFWNSSFAGSRGTYGYYSVRSGGPGALRRGSSFLGDVSTDQVGLFLQDSWTIGSRLTVNVGLRAEQEKLPSYSTIRGESPYPIEFGFSDKLAPRLGFAWDVSGDARTKVYGSYGVFYDATKLNMPGYDFGGTRFFNYYYTLDTPDWTTLLDPASCPPSCPGTLIRGPVDFYPPVNLPGNESIDPAIRPFRQREFVLGVERSFSPVLWGTLRYVHKEIENPVEDIGIFDSDGNFSYVIGNPGSGLAREAFPGRPYPKPVRDYDSVELSFHKRLANRWSARVSYLWSRLHGNYSGLASSEDLGISPNATFAFDAPIMLFDETAQAVYGPLATDRPHRGKLFVSYDFPFATSVGVVAYAASGTPITRVAAFNSAFGFPVFYRGRGSDGRTPTYSQVDIRLQHRIALGRAGLTASVNVLNLFDQKTVTGVWSYELQPGEAIDISDEDFNRGFDTQKLIEAQRLQRDPRFLKPSSYQPPREVRIGLQLDF